MKQLTQKQKNVGLGIQTGISLMRQKSLITESYRKNWLAAEKEEMLESSFSTTSSSISMSNWKKKQNTSPADPVTEPLQRLLANPTRLSPGKSRRKQKLAKKKTVNGNPHTAVGKEVKSARNKKLKRKSKGPKTHWEAVLVIPDSATSYASAGA